MSENLKSKSPKRVVIISMAIVLVLAAAFGIYRLILCNFMYFDPIFTGYGFQTDEDIQKITDKDITAVTNLLNENHISYKINDEGTGIFVQSYNRDKAVEVLKDHKPEFEGCLIN